MNENSYWDIDDVLMSEDPIRCKCETNCSFLSLIHKKTRASPNYLEGENIDLPLAIACSLIELDVISIEKPNYLTDGYYHKLKADPTVPDLSGKNKYFYEKINVLMPYLDMEDKWKKCLIQTVFGRFLHYFKNSQNVQMINTTVDNHCSFKEKQFFDFMVKMHNNIKYYRENYSNNNKVLEDQIEIKKMRLKIKKSQY